MQVPDTGTLTLDFVHLDLPAEKENEAIAEEDMDSLVRQLSKVISSPGRVDLIRQAATSFLFTPTQVPPPPFALLDAVLVMAETPFLSLPSCCSLLCASPRASFASRDAGLMVAERA